MPERLDAFMARANAAYYATHDPFADFTTAPEIAQMFGELLGAWAAVVWQGLGAPDPILLVEAGPGRGTLMSDALRVTARVAPAFRAACRVHFIENSPRLRAAQAALVPGAVWHDTLDAVPDGPAIVLANEFLDALPIRQFEIRGGNWFERHVQGGAFTLLPCAQPGVMPAGTMVGMPEAAGVEMPEAGDFEVPGGGVVELPEGGIVEVNEAATEWVSALAARLVRQGGAALILDYGRAQAGFGDSLQALRGGRPADPLADPGQADVTALVDFQALAQAAPAAGAACYGPMPQGELLHALGLRIRTERLVAANPSRSAAIRSAADRLASPARMGKLFKALALTGPRAPPPPGFA